MTTPAYAKLIDQLCELTMVSNPSAFYEQANLSVKEVDFTLRHNPSVGEGEVFIYCSYGSLPKANREVILQRLLEANLLLFSGPFSPALAYNADSQQVVLTGQAMMENLTAEQLLGLMGGIADMAWVWRKNYFLDGYQASQSKASTSVDKASKRVLGLNTVLSS